MNFEQLKSKRLFLWIVGVPLILAVAYYSFFALDRYVSMAQVAVRQVGNNEAPQMPGLAVMLSGLNPTSREETLYLREFLTSQDMLNVLQQKLNWSSHYAGRWQDPFYWLSRDARERPCWIAMNKSEFRSPSGCWKQRTGHSSWSCPKAGSRH